MRPILTQVYMNSIEQLITENIEYEISIISPQHGLNDGSLFNSC
jgi:hypothetical protein